MIDKRNNEEAELFNLIGHLTEEAFQMLIDGTLNPQQSLEVSEHLSFCDPCILRYTKLLCGSEEEETQQLFIQPAIEGMYLMSPPYPLAPSVMEQIKKKARIFYLNKFASVAVAASFALVFWVGGVFTVNVTDHSKQFLDQVHSSTEAISQNTDNFTQTIMEAISDLQQAIFELQGRFQKIVL